MKKAVLLVACLSASLLISAHSAPPEAEEGVIVEGENFTAIVERPAHEKVKVSFRDSLDGAFDISDWLITKRGFIPWPVLITEQALGGFGMGIAPIFIDPVAPRVVKGKVYPRAPNIYTAGAFYTLNKTWGVGGGASGSIPKWNSRYQLFSGYVNMNMNFYHEFPNLGEQRFEFNIRGVPLFAAFYKELGNPRFTLGINYLFIHAKIKLANGDELPDWVKVKEVKSQTAKLGMKFQYDARDNTFTPNKGVNTYLRAAWSNPIVGSDYKFGELNGMAAWYFSFARKFVSGIHAEIQQVFGDAPFYLKPYVNMRGVATNRFQGKSTVMVDLEQRWDFARRWSAVAFGGAGKAFDSYDQFGSATWAYGYGLGGRYLLARKLNLRVGVDLAMGNDGFSYYLVFGSVWNRG